MSRGEHLQSDWNLGQKRARASRACKECKSNRRKCDGKDPCKPCIDAGTPELCTYEVPKKRGRRFREAQSEKKIIEDPNLINFDPNIPTTDIPTQEPESPDLVPSILPSFRLSATVPSFSFVPFIIPSVTVSPPEIPPLPDPILEPRREQTLTNITSPPPTEVSIDIISSPPPPPPPPPEPRREQTMTTPKTTTMNEPEVPKEEQEESKVPSETQNEPEEEKQRDEGPSEEKKTYPQLDEVWTLWDDSQKKKKKKKKYSNSRK